MRSLGFVATLIGLACLAVFVKKEIADPSRTVPTWRIFVGLTYRARHRGWQAAANLFLVVGIIWMING